MKIILVTTMVMLLTSQLFAEQVIVIRSLEVPIDQVKIAKAAQWLPAGEINTNAGTARWVAEKREGLMQDHRSIAFNAEVPWEKPYQHVFRKVGVDGIADWGSLDMFWPITDPHAKPAALEKLKGFPGKNEIWLVNSNGSPVAECEVTIAYNSSKRIDHYLSNRKGVVKLDHSNLENFWNMSVRFPNDEFVVLLSGRESWERGFILVRPVVKKNE